MSFRGALHWLFSSPVHALGFDDIALSTLDEADDGFPILAGETKVINYHGTRIVSLPPVWAAVAETL